LVIELDHFNFWEFVLVDPIHKFLWAHFSVSNFLNFLIKEIVFSFLDCVSECFPVLDLFHIPVPFKGVATTCIPPTFGMLGNIDSS